MYTQVMRKLLKYNIPGPGTYFVLDDVRPGGDGDLDELHLADPLGVLLEQPLEGAHPRHQPLRVVQPVHTKDSL